MTDGLDDQGGGQPQQGPQPRAQGYPFGPGDPLTPYADAPRGNRFNYQPSQRRAHTEWGEPDDHLRFAQNYGAVVPGPWWPQREQIPHLLARGPTSLSNLMQISSGTGQRNSLQTMGALAAYLKAYQAAQDEEPRRESEALRLSLEKQAAQIDAEARDYADVLARKNLNPEQRHQAMMKIAYKYNDNNLIQTINAGDWAGAEEMLKEREARSQDYQKMIQTMDAQRRADDEHKAAEEKEKEKADTKTELTSPYQHEDSTYKPPSIGNFDPGDTDPAAGKPAGPPAVVNTPSTPAATPGSEGGGAPAAAPASDTPSMVMPGLTQATPEQDAPIQYPQTAMAGDTMSDAPPIGMSAGTQTAQATQAPDPYQQARQQELANSAALTAGATGPEHLVGRAAVDQDAQDMVMGTSKMTPKSNPYVYPIAQARAEEIKRRLGEIAASPRITPQQTLDEIRKVLPTFADQMMGYVSGAVPVPTALRNQPLLPYVPALGQKLDPTFDQNQLHNRAAIWKSLYVGPEARQGIAQLTGLDHLAWLRSQSSQALYQEGWGKGGNWAKQFYEEWAPEKWQSPEMVEHSNSVQVYQATLNTIAPEVERAQKGAAGTQGENVKLAELLGPTSRPEVRDRIIGSYEHLIWQREKNFLLNKAKALNLSSEELLTRIGHGFDNLKFDADKAADGSAGNASTNTLMRSRSEIARDVLFGKPPPLPKGMSQEDADALDWVATHPDDKRNEAIMRKVLGQ